MKFIQIITCLLFTQLCSAQYPFIVSNTSPEDSLTSILLNEYNREFDFAIAYTERGSWKRSFSYKIVGVKNDECHILDFSRKPATNNLITRTVIDKCYFMGLLSELSTLNFWTLNNDSLMQNSDGHDTLFVTHETTFVFEFINKGKYRKIYSYAPDAYVSYFPFMQQRKRFIMCRDLFKNFLKRDE